MLLSDLARHVKRCNARGGRYVQREPRAKWSKTWVEVEITPELLVERFCQSPALAVVEAGLGLNEADIRKGLLRQKNQGKIDPSVEGFPYAETYEADA